MYFGILVLAVAMATVDCVDRKLFQTFPMPQKNFKVEKYIGPWYVQLRMPTCTWVGSFDFNNYVSEYELEPDGKLLLKDTYRSKNSPDCASALLVKTPGDQPGYYELKDGFGNVLSGQSIILATDYKTFAIKWGCAKKVGNQCTDPYIVAKTRVKFPKPHTFKVIAAILDHYFKLRLDETIRVKHDDNPCVVFPEKKYHHYPLPLHHLKKTY